MQAGQLVVATPLLQDPNFARTVVLLLQADAEDGALGVVLNRPTGTGLGEVLADWEPLAGEPALVFTGGPMQPNAAICLGRTRVGGVSIGAYSPVENAPTVGTVDLDATPEELRRAVSEVRVFAGYAGWESGQLEAEVEEGAWWVLEALPSDPFSSQPGKLWEAVVRRQGPPVSFAALYPPDPTLN